MKNPKKELRGFASPNYDKKKAFAAQSKGGSAKVPKGFAMMDVVTRKKISAQGGKRRGEKV